MTALENLPTATREGYAFHTSNGFPVETCPRCDGTGRYSFNLMEGNRCRGCRGSGYVLPKGPVREIHAEMQKATRAAAHPTTAQLRPGDRVRPSGSSEHREVEHIEVLDEVCGSSLIGTDEANRTFHYYRRVHFTDGGSEKASENQGWNRAARVDTAPYIERAHAAYVQTLRRRKVQPQAEEFLAALRERAEAKAARAAGEARREQEAKEQAVRGAVDAGMTALKQIAEAARLLREIDPEACKAMENAAMPVAEAIKAAHQVAPDRDKTKA